MPPHSDLKPDATPIAMLAHAPTGGCTPQRHGVVSMGHGLAILLPPATNGISFRLPKPYVRRDATLIPSGYRLYSIHPTVLTAGALPAVQTMARCCVPAGLRQLRRFSRGVAAHATGVSFCPRAAGRGPRHSGANTERPGATDKLRICWAAHALPPLTPPSATLPHALAAHLPTRRLLLASYLPACSGWRQERPHVRVQSTTTPLPPSLAAGALAAAGARDRRARCGDNNAL